MVEAGKQHVGLFFVVVPAAVADEGHGQPVPVLVVAQGEGLRLLVYIISVVLRGGVQNHHVGLGGVVFVLHAGGGRFHSLLQPVDHRRVHLHLPQHFPELPHRHAAGAQHPGGALRQGEHGGLHPHGAVAPVQQGVHPAGEILPHMGEGGGAGLAGQVGGGGRQGQPRLPDHRLGHRVSGKPHRHRVQAAAGLPGHQVRLFQDDGQRPGPEGGGQLLGALWQLAHQGRQLGEVADVDDEGIVRGPALGLVNGLHRRPVQGVGGQAVHRLGGDGHQAPPAQDLPGGLHVLGAVSPQEDGMLFQPIHSGHPAFLLMPGPPAGWPGPRR